MLKEVVNFAGSLAYLTAANHGLADECEEIISTFNLDPAKVILFCHFHERLNRTKEPLSTRCSTEQDERAIVNLV